MFEAVAFIGGIFIGFFCTSAYYRSQIRQKYIFIGDTQLSDIKESQPNNTIKDTRNVLYAKMKKQEIKRREF